MRAAIYTRISRDAEGERQGVTRQLEDCAALADRLGWEVVDHFDDNDLSAFNGTTRPRFEAMLDAIKHDEIDAVICWHPDRLYRSLKDLVRLLEVGAKTQIRTVNGGDIDLSTSTGKMLATILGSVATQESEHKAERQTRANRQRAMNGNPWVSRPFGYTHAVDREKAEAAGKTWNPVTDKHSNRLVPAEAKVIREGCDALLNGASLYSIAQEWNAAGITTVNGCTWSGGTVKQVLARPRNAGLAVHQGTVLADAKVKWPAIIELDTHDAVKALLADPKRHSGKRRARAYLLTGLALCGACGKPLGSNTRPTKKPGVLRAVYCCKRPGCMRIVRSMDRVDAVVVDVICEKLSRPDAAEVLATPSVDKAKIRDQVNNLRGRLAATREHWLAERISDGEWFAKRDRLQGSLDAAEAKLMDANRSRTLDGLVGQPDAAQRFAAMSLDRRRAVVDCLVAITIEPNTKAGGQFDHRLVKVTWK